MPSWTVYHGDTAGSGVAASVTSVDVSSPAWTSTSLDGQLYGEPLVSGERVYVATENDTVYALSANDRRRAVVDSPGYARAVGIPSLR